MISTLWNERVKYFELTSPDQDMTFMIPVLVWLKRPCRFLVTKTRIYPLTFSINLSSMLLCSVLNLGVPTSSVDRLHVTITKCLHLQETAVSVTSENKNTSHALDSLIIWQTFIQLKQHRKFIAIQDGKFTHTV